ncbi:MAG: HemK2/MTQ2 family protein methyltransferase [Candidatus Micrarchaeota archaeon]
MKKIANLKLIANIQKAPSVETIEFEGVILTIQPTVYLPREDSFLLAKAVQQLATGTVLDIGTGSGIQAIVAAQKQEVTSVTAVDLSKKALSCAEKNVEQNHVATNKIKFINSNLFQKVNSKQKFDTIIFNPPYVPVEKSEIRDEESMAWHGGATGREILDKFLVQFPKFLAPNGKLLLLQSSLNNVDKTKEILQKLGFNCKEISSQAFFFERIYVHKVTKI